MIAMLLPYAAESFPLRIRGRTTGTVAACTKAGGMFAQFLAILALVPPLDVVSLIIIVPTIVALVLVAMFGKETRGRDLRDLDPDGQPSRRPGYSQRNCLSLSPHLLGGECREAHLVWEVGAELGEGPVWDERDQALWFTDIKRQKIHRYDPRRRRGEAGIRPSRSASCCPRRAAGSPRECRAASTASSRRRMRSSCSSRSSPTFRATASTMAPWIRPGGCGSGRWTTASAPQTGAFYCFHRGKLKRTNVTGIAITNGPAISPEGGTLYWVDTLGGTISACEICDDGELGPSRLVVRIRPRRVIRTDRRSTARAHLDQPLRRGRRRGVIRQPASFSQRVRFPVSNITKIAFGGLTSTRRSRRPRGNSSARSSWRRSRWPDRFSPSIPTSEGVPSPPIAD